MDLFNHNFQNRKFQKIKLKDGEVWYMEDFISSEEANTKIYFKILEKQINWKQEKIKIYGKTHPVPRLTALYGNEGVNYKYSGMVRSSDPWIPELLEIKRDIEVLLDHHEFNSVLLNLYRDGNDKVGWHADNEKELGKNPLIASLSLGTSRRFDLKHRTDSTEKLSLELTPGSLIIMKGALQHHWLHQIPAQKKVSGPRINLTFRTIFK